MILYTRASVVDIKPSWPTGHQHAEWKHTFPKYLLICFAIVGEPSGSIFRQAFDMVYDPLDTVTHNHQF